MYSQNLTAIFFYDIIFPVSIFYFRKNVSGLPIKDFDFFLAQLTDLNHSVKVNNHLLRELVSRLTPTTSTSTIEDMPAPLIIKRYFPTGINFQLPIDFSDVGGQEWLREKLDSKIGIDGYKGFAFESFDLNISRFEGYDLTVNVDNNFKTLDIDSPPYIQCYLLDSVKLARLLIMLLAGWANYNLGHFPGDIVKRVTEGAFADESSSLTSIITLRPNLLTAGGLFFVKVQSIGWKSAVIDYDNESRTFTILGF